MVECRCTELETRCVDLESVIARKTSENEALEAKFRSLEVEKASIEEKLKALQEENDNQKKVVVLTKEADDEGAGGEEEEAMVTQLMIENTVLQCEKRIAETEIEGLKQKLNDLASKFEATKTHAFVNGGKGDVDLGFKMGRRVGRRLKFEEDNSKKMAPSTPCVGRSSCLGVIDICDTDDEKEEQRCVDSQGIGDACISTDGLRKGAHGEKETMMMDDTEKDDCNENLNDFDDGGVLSVLTPKRKRASKIVASDSENEENDDVPICKLKRRHLPEMISGQASSGLNSELGTLLGDDDISNVATPRRRLVSLRKLEGQKRIEKGSSSKTVETKRLVRIPTTEDNVNDESEKDDSSSKSDSINEFIVESTEESNYDDSSNEQDESDDSRHDQDESEDNEDFGEIISRINRSKHRKSSWEFEADMLSAFGKDPELCMKAVCALYRQQTSDEQINKETFVNNLRGFSKFDANRGSNLAQFLTDGDPGCELKKSVEDLKAYDPSGVEKCRTLATRYSKQLFQIYKNKEDPLFLPC